MNALSFSTSLFFYMDYYYYALMHRYEFRLLFGEPRYSINKPYAHVSFKQWNEQRNEFLFEKLLIFYILSIFDYSCFFLAFAFRYILMELKSIYLDERTNERTNKKRSPRGEMSICISIYWRMFKQPHFHCLFTIYVAYKFYIEKKNILESKKFGENIFDEMRRHQWRYT